MAKGLGKGLGALFNTDIKTNTPLKANKKVKEVKVSKNSSKNINKKESESNDVTKLDKEIYKILPLDDISPNPNQPRKHFNEESLLELAESIKNTGIIQPLIVNPYTKKNGKTHYIIVAGERRWRASKKAGLLEVPAVIRKLDEKTLLKQALIENIQRENINVMEEAIALQTLKDEHGMTQEELSFSTGKSRSNIAQILRLLSLPLDIQQLISKDLLSLGHARPLISLDKEEDQLFLAKEIVDKSLSVRQTEEKVQHFQKKPKKTVKIKSEEESSEAENKKIIYKVIEEKLSDAFHTKVNVMKKKNGSGEIKFYYYSEEELENLLDIWKINIE